MTNKEISQGLRPARWWKMWEKPSQEERVTSQGCLSAKKCMKGNIIRMCKMIGVLEKVFLVFLGGLEHNRQGGGLCPDGGSRALEAIHCWVLLWERGGNQGLWQLAGQGAEVGCKPLTMALRATSNCVKLQRGTHLSREDGSQTTLSLGQGQLSLCPLSPRVWASETAIRIKMGNRLTHWLVI